MRKELFYLFFMLSLPLNIAQSSEIKNEDTVDIETKNILPVRSESALSLRDDLSPQGKQAILNLNYALLKVQESEEYWQTLYEREREDQEKEIAHQKEGQKGFFIGRIQTGRTSDELLYQKYSPHLFNFIKKISPVGSIDYKKWNDQDFLSIAEWCKKAQKIKLEIQQNAAQKRKEFILKTEMGMGLSDYARHILPSQITSAVPAFLIMKINFDRSDSKAEQARKLTDLGLRICATNISGLTSEDKNKLVAYSFVLAGYNYLNAAASAEAGEWTDLYISAGQLFMWAAHRFHDHQAALNNIHRGQEALQKALACLDLLEDEQQPLLDKIETELVNAREYEKIRKIALDFENLDFNRIFSKISIGLAN